MSDVPAVTPEIPSATWRGILAVLKRLPQASLSRGFGQLADMKLPARIRRTVLGMFARALRIDLDEAENTIDEYESINQLFVRRLKPGSRAWPVDPHIIASPVDGVLGQIGRCADGALVQAKGRTYTASALLDDPNEAERFRNGSFITLYLSPRHYHRIHTPCAGEIALARHLPGQLLPVNAAAVAHVPDLFARNERLLAYVDGAAGRIACIAIGAYNVGRISAAFDPGWGDWVSNRKTDTPETRHYDPPKRIETGDEIMAFHLGSTVVLLFEPGVQIDRNLAPGEEVRVGEPIARSGV